MGDPRLGPDGQRLLELCFPFWLSVAPEGTITAVSERLATLLPGLRGRELLSQVTVRRPRGVTSVEALRAATGTVLVLDTNSRSLTLRGQLIALNESGDLLFVGTPWFTDTQQVARSGLRLTDFAPQDPIVEYLSLLQASREQTSRTKLLAERLATSEARYRHLWTRTFDLVHTLDARGRLLSVNDAWCEQLGYRREDVLGRPLQEMTAPESIPVCRAGLRRILAGETLNQVQVALLDRHGEHVHLVGSVVPAVANREVVGAEGFFRNVTLERRARTELEELNRELEARVAARTSEAAEAQARAEEASRAKSVFIANMSHEIRTPMNAVLGYASLLEHDASTPPEQRAWALGISRAGEHLLKLLNGILDLSKIEAGKLEVRTDSVNLHGLLRDIEGILGPAAATKGLAFHVEHAPDLPRFVRTDAGKVRQILLNLGSNAVKFTASGRVEVKVRWERLGEQRLSLVIEVIDTGVGIPPEERDRLFENFHQATAGAAAGSGTGLGLSLSRRFARLLGGDITVHEGPEGGAMFRFAITVEGSRPPSARSSDGRPVLAKGPGSAAALIVDDTPTNLEVLSLVLGRIGFRVRTASSGEEATEQAREDRWDVVLMDLRMPGMGGLEAIRQIRSDEEGEARVPIIVVTASAFDEDVARAAEAGADAFLPKPVSHGALAQTIARISSLQLVTKERSPSESETDQLPSPPPLAPPPPALLEALDQAAAVGDVDALEAAMDELAQGHRPLVRRWRDALDSFDYERLRAEIELVREGARA